MLVHASTYQGSIWYQLFEPLPYYYTRFQHHIKLCCHICIIVDSVEYETESEDVVFYVRSHPP